MLESPIDGTVDVPLEHSLCWTPVSDPDGDQVRYRVFVDDTELTEGIQGEIDGYDGPCVGPLSFVHARSYSWQVLAFEVDDPTHASDRSEPWVFTTLPDPQSSVVFEDGFDDDLGWTRSGDARTGAWIRAEPEEVEIDGILSQPGRCDGGESCYFTGANPEAVASDEDVSGGSTVLTSPPFDLQGAAAATVQLRRFFFKSDATSGPELRVELLVPDDAAPDGYQTYELETLEATSAESPHNRWTPREYVACDAPMVDGSRLRITATDDGTGILEAAIDTVTVRAQHFDAVCGSGDGGFCDPSSIPSACDDGLLCCATAVVNDGAHRCSVPVAGLDFANPTPDPDSPGNGPLGCDAPDLMIDESWIEPEFNDIMISDDSCELLEGCVDGLGWRTILRFSLMTANIGSSDLTLGVAANQPDIFHYSSCHDHYHFDEYAQYELRDAEGVVARGHKQAFCLLDSSSWAWRNAFGKFDCANQGISRGFEDLYETGLACQWIDVTDVPPGEYILRASVNYVRPDAAMPLLNERDYDNNVVEVPVTVP